MPKQEKVNKYKQAVRKSTKIWPPEVQFLDKRQTKIRLRTDSMHKNKLFVNKKQVEVNKCKQEIYQK